MRSPLLQNFPETPLQEDAFAGGERDVCLLGEFGHHVHVEGLHHLFVEPRLIRFQRFDQKPCRRRLYGAMKIDANIDARAMACP